MFYIKNIFQDRSIIKYITAILALELFSLAFKLDIFGISSFIYLIIIPLLLPTLVTESNKYLFKPELISRSNRPAKYFFVAQARRSVFILIISLTLAVSNTMVTQFYVGETIYLYKIILTFIVLCFIGFLISALIDLTLLLTKNLLKCLVIIIIAISFDYAITGMTEGGVMYNSILFVRNMGKNTSSHGELISFVILILLLASASIIVIYKLNISDYIQDAGEIR